MLLILDKHRALIYQTSYDYYFSVNYFSIIYRDQWRDCIPYNHFVITVTLCLDYLKTAQVKYCFCEFQRGKWRFILNTSAVLIPMHLSMSYYAYSTLFFCCGCASSARQHSLPVFKILTMPQQERVSLCFIYYIQFVSHAQKSSDGGQCFPANIRF